ncbi:flagellar hook-associated protein FlgL [Aquabacterium sp. A7-Y]|uniref:flagellar hook-associated protein FlgL n=1 Tax=Aquabacterium sp. A7-Y TaxID=1349605 RepID=UPI00223D5449|nr:flagellar hook-associated protein FlgL [Aquabacterium sp. A7-Y]MCW7540505.1 flagellar hook-associated protein FlgL [Aquabacterium sp. A7-Y]
MRVSTAQTYDASVANLQQRQSDLSDAQVRLTSGKRVMRGSDDPTSAARAERALAQEERAVVAQRAVEASRNAMRLSESALGDAVGVLQSARDSLVNAGNSAYTQSEQDTLVTQLQQYRQQLLQVANRDDGAGSYLFAGQGSPSKPFLESGATVIYNGTAGEVAVASGESLPVSVDGNTAWMTAMTGNGVFETRDVAANTGKGWIDAGQIRNPAALTGADYAIDISVAGGVTQYTVTRNGAPTGLTNVEFRAGQPIEIDGMSFVIDGAPAAGDRFEIVPSEPTLSVFEALDSAIAALKSGGNVPQGVSNGLRDLDSVLSRMQGVRSSVGDTLNRIDKVEDRLAASKLNAQTDRTNAEDLDLVEAISKFQEKQNGYDAALQTYAKVQRMSLFDYIR